MPFRKNEPFRVHMAPHHPPIYEQGGHFFYPDGCEVPLEVAKRLLDYNPELCKRWGIPVNHQKRYMMEHYEENEDKILKRKVMGRYFEPDVVFGG